LEPKLLKNYSSSGWRVTAKNVPAIIVAGSGVKRLTLFA